MIDTRCYKCAENVLTEEDMQGKFAEKHYQGNGIFKCPWCGDVTDLSNKTYTTKIYRTYDEDGSLISDIIEFDSKLDQQDKDVFEQDMLELDVFDDIPYGKYILEVLWYYYQCGGYEYPNEYDIKIEILSEKEVNK